MFDITFFPATYGDSIWITYGKDGKDLHHILIDGGTAGTRDTIAERLLQIQAAGQSLDLVVVTHIDRDHIEGILSIFEKLGNVIRPKDFWFNGYKHLATPHEYEEFGPKQGEKVSTFITKHGVAWNDAFSGNAVVVPDDGPLPSLKLEGGMKITLLSPYREQLEKLLPVWEKEIIKAGLTPGSVPVTVVDPAWEEFGAAIPDVAALSKEPFKEDEAVANGSSIALLLEFDGKRALLTGDAHPSVIIRSLDRIKPQIDQVDLFKLSHHGSKGNTSPELFKRVVAASHVISTNGSNYGHPDQPTIARLITLQKGPKNLVFNYRSKFNEMWVSKLYADKYNYTTIFGKDGEVTVPLSS